MAPHVHGLLEEPPNQSCQRYLILISKTLQHLASGTLPEKKDEFSKKIAEFISINQTPLHEYIDKLAVRNFPPKNKKIIEIKNQIKY